MAEFTGFDNAAINPGYGFHGDVNSCLRAQCDRESTASPDSMDVAFAADSNYLKYCAVAIASLCHETQSIPLIRCHLLIGQGMPASALDTFEQALRPFAGRLELQYHPISMELPFLKNVQTCKHIQSETTYYRLYLPQLLAGKVDKILYLDCDLVICRDIGELWRADLGGACLGGVEDRLSSMIRQALFLPEDACYVNAGVLLWDLKQMDVEDFSRRLQAVSNGPLHPLIQNGDQDLLAVLLHDRTRYLPARWNVAVQDFPFWRYRTFAHCGQHNTLNRDTLRRSYVDPGIVHYTGPFKPWNAGWFYDALSLQWFQYARMTGYPQEEWVRRHRRARLVVAAHWLAGKPPNYRLHRHAISLANSVSARFARRRDVDASLVARRNELLRSYNLARRDRLFSATELAETADRRIGVLGWARELDAYGLRGNLRLLFATPRIEAIEKSSTLGEFDAFLWYFLRDDEKLSLQTRILEQAIADDKPIYFVEPGPIASILNTETRQQIPLRFRRSHSFIVDDRAFYFDALLESRIRQRLESEEDVLDANLISRCRKAIGHIVDHRLTKYNFLVDDEKDIASPPPGGRVLVVDQAVGDASVWRAGSGASTFDAMISAARTENPDADIYIKTHPDGRIRKKGFLKRNGRQRTRLLRSWSNPFSVLALMDKVYTCSSQFGFEALMAGRRVVTFGQAHYAGWGLTDDRHPAAAKKVTRSLEALFHGLFLLNTIYLDPWRPCRIEFEDYLERMTALREDYRKYMRAE